MSSESGRKTIKRNLCIVILLTIIIAPSYILLLSLSQSQLEEQRAIIGTITLEPQDIQFTPIFDIFYQSDTCGWLNNTYGVPVIVSLSLTMYSDADEPLLLEVRIRTPSEFTGGLTLDPTGGVINNEYTLRFSEIPSIPGYLITDIQNVTRLFEFQGINWFIDQTFSVFNTSTNEIGAYSLDVYIHIADFGYRDEGLLTVTVYPETTGDYFSLTFFTNTTIVT